MMAEARSTLRCSFPRPMAALTLLSCLTVSLPAPADGQILNRLRRRAEEVLDQTSVLERLLEEPPGITTSIHDAHTEIPFLDGHDPKGSANLWGLPRDGRGAFFAPPGLYDMEALSYCIHAGTYGPTGGEGYSLAPLQGDLAPVLRAVVNRSVDHPEISQQEIQSLIWALQSRIPINEMSRELQVVAEILLDPGQVDALSEGFVDLAKEELLSQARDRMPEAVRRVAEVEANLRELLRGGATFDELEQAAVLVGAPPPEEWVRDVPALRWNYHPDGYFIRFSPRDYTQTYVQTYVPEEYLVGRDGEGRVTEVMGPRGVRLVLEYGEGGGEVGLLRRVRILEGGRALGVWEGEGWTLLGNNLGPEVPGSVVDRGRLETRREEARELRGQMRQIIADARGSDPGRPGADLADLSHLRTALLEAGGAVPEEVLVILTNAWQYALCVEAGGCGQRRVGWRGLPLSSLAQAGLHGPAAGAEGGEGAFLVEPARIRAGGGASIDPGGNVAAPGNTGGQRLLQSGKTPVEKANLAMKVMGIFLALADVIGSGSLGAAAYNALGMGGLPVGPIGIPTMLAGAMISQVVGMWSDATDALAGETGSGSGGDAGGGDGGSEGGGDSGGFGQGGIHDPLGDPRDPSEVGGAGGGGGDRTGSRSDGSDFENTPPPSPPPNPSPAPGGGGGGGGGGSGQQADAANAFAESLIETLYHTQGLADSQLRQEAACQAGDSEWANRQAALAGEHQRAAALGMIQAARRLDALLEMSPGPSDYGSQEAYPEDLEAVQSRLRTRGWASEESRTARLLGITDGEMEGLRQHLLAQAPEEVSGDLMESAREWGRQLRTAGLLWMALPQPTGVCRIPH